MIEIDQETGKALTLELTHLVVEAECRGRKVQVWQNSLNETYTVEAFDMHLVANDAVLEVLAKFFGPEKV